MSNEPTSGRWTTGNANNDSTSTRGWLVGHFIDSEQDIRATDDVEVKWAHHAAGDERPEWTSGEWRTTLVILIYGEFHIDLTVGSKILRRQGEYAMWGPGIEHYWKALSKSLVITVRWPSGRE